MGPYSLSMSDDESDRFAVDFDVHYYGRKRRRTWENVESAAFPLDRGDGCVLTIVRGFLDEGVSCCTLFAMVSLLGRYSRIGMPVTLLSGRGDSYKEHLSTVTDQFLCDKVEQHLKLACLRFLMRELLPPPGDTVEDLEVVQDTFEYILGRECGWNKPVHAELDLFKDLREMCLASQKETETQAEVSLEQKRKTSRQVVRGGEVVIEKISALAETVQMSLAVSTPVISSGIGTTGDLIKLIVIPDTSPPKKDGVLASVYVEKARQVTGGVQVGVQTAANSVKGASCKGVAIIAQKFENKGFVEKMVPDQDHRAVVLVAGKVGMAGLSATVIVGEAIHNLTSEVVNKTVAVTADVVRYKYGDSAGRIVQDISDATGNIMLTATHVTVLEGKAFTRVVAESTVKVHSRQGYIEENPQLKPESDILSSDAHQSIETKDLTNVLDEFSWLRTPNEQNQNTLFHDKL